MDTAEQLRSFLQFVAENQYLPAWIFLATSGSRRDETLGLPWSVVDLDGAMATISHQVTSVQHRIVHSSTHITREIYTHVTPPMQTDAAERVGAPYSASKISNKDGNGRRTADSAR